jgi:hypothetical protein
MGVKDSLKRAGLSDPASVISNPVIEFVLPVQVK